MIETRGISFIEKTLKKDRSWFLKYQSRSDEHILSALSHQAELFDISLYHLFMIEFPLNFQEFKKTINLLFAHTPSQIFNLLEYRNPQICDLISNIEWYSQFIGNNGDNYGISTRNSISLYNNTLNICPVCWKDNNSRYLKKHWLYSWVIVCDIHNCLLIDSCPKCTRKFNFHRVISKNIKINLEFCLYCNYFLVDLPDIEYPDFDYREIQNEVTINIINDNFSQSILNPGKFFGLHRNNLPNNFASYFKILNMKRGTRLKIRVYPISFEFDKIEFIMKYPKFLYKNNEQNFLELEKIKCFIDCNRNIIKKNFSIHLVSHFKHKCHIQGCSYTSNRIITKKHPHFIKNHFIKDHSRKRKKSKERLKESEYPCDFLNCKHVAKSSENLKIHRRTHTGEHPYPCDFPGCNYAASQSGTLTRHQRTHSDERPYPCDFPRCNYAAKQKSSLKDHQRTHSEERPYPCDFPGCHYSAKRKYTIKVHQRTHSGERPYPCDFPRCYYSAKRKNTLKDHQRTHSEERPYPCDFPGCNYAAKRKYTLKVHQSAHNKTK